MATEQFQLSESELENLHAAKGHTAPRLTPQHVDSCILTEQYWQPPGTTLTVCVLTLKNGFHVVGESAAAHPDNFDPEIGKRLSRDRARDKIWMLEGYLLRSKLAEARNG